jgi:hypothetical protein
MAVGPVCSQVAGRASVPGLDPAVWGHRALGPPALAAVAEMVAAVVGAPDAAAVAVVPEAAEGARVGRSPSVRWLPPLLSLLAALP